MSDEDSLEVCEAVKLVLQRMDSNPDEFLDPTDHDPFGHQHNRWSTLMERHWNSLTVAEQTMLKEKKKKLRVNRARKEFHDAVVKELLVGGYEEKKDE